MYFILAHTWRRSSWWDSWLNNKSDFLLVTSQSVRLDTLGQKMSPRWNPFLSAGVEPLVHNLRVPKQHWCFSMKRDLLILLSLLHHTTFHHLVSHHKHVHTCIRTRMDESFDMMIIKPSTSELQRCCFIYSKIKKSTFY